MAVVIVMPAQAFSASSSSKRSDVQRLLSAEKHHETRGLLKSTIKTPQRPTFTGPSASDPDSPRFLLRGIILDGARAISVQQLSRTYAPLIGQEISIDDLAVITDLLTKVYQDAGYSLSRAIVPPQDIENGTVRIQIIEGAVHEIVVEGASAAEFGLDRVLSGLREERPLTQRTLERHLLLANDIPGIKVADTTLDEIGELTGRFRLTVIVEAWGLHVASGYNDRGTHAVGPVEGANSLSVNSLFVGGDSLGFGVSSTPLHPDELLVGRVSYAIPIGRHGATADISYSRGTITPSDGRRFYNTRTRSERLAVGASITPLRSQALSVRLRVSGDITDLKEEEEAGTIYADHVRAVAVGSNVEVQDDYGGFNFFSAYIRRGFGGWGATKKGDPLSSRNGASGEFTSAQLSATRFQKITDAWSASATVAGQLASTSLLSVEEYNLGGVQFGRAFDGGTIGGDDAIAGSLELRFDQELEWGLFRGYQLYGFADHGHVWNYYSGGHSEARLTSGGGGVRLYLAGGLEVEAELAVPIHYDYDGEDVDDWSVHFALSKSFQLCRGENSFGCASRRIGR